MVETRQQKAAKEAKKGKGSRKGRRSSGGSATPGRMRGNRAQLLSLRSSAASANNGSSTSSSSGGGNQLRRSSRIAENNGASEGGENIDPNTSSSSPKDTSSSADRRSSRRSPLALISDDDTVTNNGSAPAGGEMDEEQEGEGDEEQEGEVDDDLPDESELVKQFGQQYADKILLAQKQIQSRKNSGAENPGFLPTYHKDPVPWKKQLGTWARKQREDYKRKKLSAKRIKVLEKIGFQWSESNDQKWDYRYAQLLEFRRKFQHCNVPRDYENKKLANWVKDQRSKCKDPVRKKMLDDIGFVWQPLNKEWEDTFALLGEYKVDHHGDCNVPRDCIYKNKKLGVWVHNQRTKCEDPVRKKMLTDIGFVWQVYKANPRKKEEQHLNENTPAQNVSTITTSTTVPESLELAERAVEEAENLNIATLLWSVHFASLFEDWGSNYHWRFRIHNHEERRTFVKTSQAHYMTPEKERLILGKNIIFFYLLIDDDGKLLFAGVDHSGKKFVEVEVEGGVSLSNCLKHCMKVQEERAGDILVCFSIQLMTPGSTEEAKDIERECQDKLRELGSIVMHAKKYSSGITTEGAYGHIALMNVTIGVEDCLKNKKLRLTTLVPQDSRPALIGKFPKLKFYDWPKPEPKPEDDEALDILQVDSTKSTVFEGKTFVITGEINRLRQETVAKAITDRGGIVLKDFKPGVENCYLILGGAASERKKANAKAINAEILDKEKFLKLVVKEEKEEKNQKNQKNQNQKKNKK